ncbi:MAG TPA: hypothetical protein VM076_05510 [Gemmatimonadaceae bacterium]|nr:hypothetical protein [Gemmatimonadaceae bacterium]
MTDPRDPSGAVAADYTARGATFAAAQRVERARAERISQLRLLAFAVAAAAIIALLAGRGPRWLVAVGAVAGVVAYVAAARRHSRLRRAAAWAGVRRVVCEQGRFRVERKWDALLSPVTEMPPSDHAFGADLDIGGRASLARLLDVTSAGPGRRTALSWLLGSAPSTDEIRARQDAVRELAPATEWRETLTAHAWSAAVTRRSDVDRFLTWAEQAPWLIDRWGILWASRVLPFVIVPMVVLALLNVMWTRGVIAAPMGWMARVAAVFAAWWTVPVGASVLLSFIARRPLLERIQAAISHLGGLTAYAEMLAHVEAAPFKSPRMAGVRQRLGTGRGAAGELTRLGAIVRLAEARYSPMAHFALQLLGLWDFHVLAALERWQRTSGAHARDWLAALGEAEALSAFATLAYDNPDWVMPELVEGDARVEARALGHPLLSAHARVSNDVTVGPPGTFLLVTGSNMSGKSTLLRAIGTNVVLAQAGGPVCAAALRLTPVDVWTSIRIDDSLEAGVSLFMAELKRLKRIVDAARDESRTRPLLYLLDEMLHGTNTAERQIAARRVLGYLVEARAIGAVTTHDLTLAEHASLDRAAQRVHFTEQFAEREGAMTMTFDYRLRPGLATSANALKLLAMIGLE